MKKLASLAVCVTLATVGLIAPAAAAYAAESPTTTAVAADSAATATDTTETYHATAERVIAAAAVPEDVKAKLRAYIAAVPVEAVERLARLNAKLGIADTQWSEIRSSVINPDDYQCATTDVRDWSAATTSGWELIDQIVWIFTPVGEMPTYDALLFGTESKTSTFGRDGGYTSLLTSQMKDLRSFWDINGSDIQLVPMHGASIFTDRERIVRIYEVFAGSTPEVAAQQADLILDLMDIAPGLKHGDHPLFTFNAFAFDPQGDPELLEAGLNRRIVMGDGILQAFTEIGIDAKVAPRSILAHEYGHHIQFQRNLFDSPLTGPEATRRTELQADAFGTYFMVYSRGEALNQARTLADQKTFYNVGDCGFTGDGHHGTPNQRFASAAWAAGVANAQADQGHRFGSLPFAALFDAKLPELVAPDAR